MIISNKILNKLHDSASLCRKPLTVWNVLVVVPAAFTQLMVLVWANDADNVWFQPFTNDGSKDLVGDIE